MACLFLAGCASSDDGGPSGAVSHAKKPTNPGIGNGTLTPNGQPLDKFVDTGSAENTIKALNTSRINSAVRKYNEGKAAAEQIPDIDPGKATAGLTKAYEAAKAALEQNLTDAFYISNKISDIGVPGASGTDGHTGIPNLESAYTDYAAAVLVANNDTNIQTAKNKVVEALKILDASVTQFPVDISAVMEYYRTMYKIMKAVQPMIPAAGNPSPYIPVLSVGPGSAMTARESDATTANVTFTPNAVTGYTITITDPLVSGRSATLIPEDFKYDGKFYTATQTSSQPTNTTPIATFKPDLKAFIYGGGSAVQAEIDKRKQQFNDIVTAIRNTSRDNLTKPDPADSSKTVPDTDKIAAFNKQIDTFNSWFGVSIPSNTTWADMQAILTTQINSLLTIANSIMNASRPNFDIFQEIETKDTVTLGGKTAGLQYSNFGIWTVEKKTVNKGDAKYVEDAQKSGTVTSGVEYKDYTAYAGLDSLKQDFYILPNNPSNGELRFSGRAIGVAEKTGGTSGQADARLNITGTAELSLSNASLINPNTSTIAGSANPNNRLVLAFENWHTLTFKGFDAATVGDGIVPGSGTSIELTGSPSDEWKINQTMTITGTVNGQGYGIETGYPTEVVGDFALSGKPIDSNYTDISVTGAWGVKK
jgi:hypothetical protein